MKINSLNFLKPVIASALCLALIGLFSACDKIPFFQKESGENVGEQGIVQTDWRSADEIEVEPETTADNKIGVDSQPAASSESTTGTGSKVDQPSPGDSADNPNQVPASKNEFAVQLGAFLNPDNASRLISRLKKKGYNASLLVVETSAKKWNLVRIGSFLDKKSAVAAAKKFTLAEKMETAVVKDRKIVKMQAKIRQQESVPGVKLEPKKQTEMKAAMPVTVATFEPERFTFQIGGLRSRANAAKYKKALKKQGYKPFIKKIISRQSNETWYSLRIGEYDTIDQAADAATEFTEKESIPAQAVSMNH